MSRDAAVLAHAMCDAGDRLLTADEPLAGLQVRCGGELPGMIAVPELLELVEHARRSRLRLSRVVHAQDGTDMIAAWIEVEPDDEGCAIRVQSWHTEAPLSDEGAAAEQRRIAIDRHLAELTAYLDAGQHLLTAQAHSAALRELAARMDAAAGALWTEYLPPENVAHQQPLHWRLLDGARVAVSDSRREWRVALVPHTQPGREPSGFELLLLSDEPETAALMVTAPSPSQPRPGLVGQDLAPVLKQPIARIVANAETIRTRLAGPLPDAYADYAGEIVSAGTLLLGLLEDMADLEIVEADGFSTKPDAIDLSDVARQAAGILNVRAREKGIRISLPDAGDALPAFAEFRRVLQILLNLIGNAIRYSAPNSQITIVLDRRGDRTRVIVGDEGPGLSAAEQARVFNKFERLGRNGDGGSGLGLYISQRLANAMDGDLRVESAPGVGARFILDLPADPEG